MAEVDISPVLDRLTRLGFDDTSGAVVARALIFHLACAAEGRPYQNPVDPRRPLWDVLELRRLDAKYKADALALIVWSVGPVWSWQPLFDASNRILEYFEVRFAPEGERERQTVGAGRGGQAGRED